MIEIIDKLNENLAILLDCENENNQNYSKLVEVILNQIFDKTLDLNTELRHLHEEFPNMSMVEWTILRHRWEIFMGNIYR